MPMSTGTKRILAIVVVAVIVVGIVGVYLVITPSGPQYQTPGMPAGVASNRIIKIGILDPMTEIQGDSCWKGAYMAVREINTAGGILINGTDRYYLGLIAEDTYEADPSLDVTKGVAAAQKILTVDGAQFIIGGFRTESLKAYIEAVMDKKTVFIGTGASTDYFCKLVYDADHKLDSYNRYKYWFRIMPINSTSLGGETITELGYLRGNLTLRLGKPVKNWAILRESLDWTIPMDLALKTWMPAYGWNATPALDLAYPITATSSDFATYWQQLNASKAQVVIPIISAQGGTYMMTQYNATKPQCLIVGIDVPSQLDTFWTSTNGKAAYEVIMQPLVYTNKTSQSKTFWNNYLGNYSVSPLYTGIGAYDAVNTLAWAIGNCSSLSSDKVVTALESIKSTSPTVLGNSRLGVAGRLWFTRSHDLFEGYNFGGSKILWSVTLWTQWHPDGKKYCITSFNKLYPDSIVTGTLMLPPWGINSI